MLSGFSGRLFKVATACSNFAWRSGQNFLKTMQWDECEGKTRDDAFYGGAGYGGGNSRPDLSNTAFFMEPCATPACRPMIPTCRRPLFSCRGART